MPSLLESLKSLVNVDISNLKSVNIFSNIKLNFTHKTVNQTLIVNTDKLSKEKSKLLGETLKQFVNQENGLILEEGAAEVLDEIKKVEESKIYNAELSYWAPKLRLLDLQILRASIILKIQFDKNARVSDLKKDIIRRYGDRGRNTCNLYSGGYFASHIKPLYGAMETAKGFTLKDFQRQYEMIVTEMPYAVFISSSMTDIEIEKTVLERMKNAKNYGMKYLNIHGIGYENVSKIIYLINNLTPKLKNLPSISSDQNVITVKVSTEIIPEPEKQN